MGGEWGSSKPQTQRHVGMRRERSYQQQRGQQQNAGELKSAQLLESLIEENETGGISQIA